MLMKLFGKKCILITFLQILYQAYAADRIRGRAVIFPSGKTNDVQRCPGVFTFPNQIEAMRWFAIRRETLWQDFSS